MQSQRVKPSYQKRNKQKGQISIFIGLTFLILFTMFAMTINVAMTVHDKINLQNAVDFASIYVAQRQAEQLNAIAHFNYQIRQAHKLMTFRHIVIGTAGIVQDGKGPTIISQQNVKTGQESEYVYFGDEIANKNAFPPCIANKNLFEDVKQDGWCQPSFYDGGFGGIPKFDHNNPFGPFNYELTDTTISLGTQIVANSILANVFTWWFVNLNMANYRLQIAYRKGLIRALAANLAKPIVAGPGGMKDLYGESVYGGAFKTFRFNLSESNLAITSSFNFEVKNSLEGVAIKDWLPEIKTWVVPTYAYNVPKPNCGSNNVGCVGGVDQLFYFELPPGINEKCGSACETFLDEVDPDEFLRSFLGGGNMPLNSDFEEILGFEKNPWYMVYNHVSAQTISNALFNPMPGTQISAQAFSKPFGGRIGPWYSKRWPQGAPTSNGGGDVSELWSPRKKGDGGAPEKADDPTFIPNSPKYPGDHSLGWKSSLALTSVGQIGFGNAVIKVDDYINTVRQLYADGNGDALAVGHMRRKELAALAPDLFDIYYYSFDPNFHENYLENKLDKWLMSETNYKEVPYQQNKRIWRDLGYREDGGSLMQKFSVHNQLTESTRKTLNLGPKVFYALEGDDANGRANILTSWVGGRQVASYDPPTTGSVASRFGKCQKFYEEGKHPVDVPGECLEGGGRTGYSVKVISKDYLKSSEHNMGAGVTGAILNPPED